MSNKILPLGGKGRENVLTKWRSTRWKLKLRGEEIARKHVIAATTNKRCIALQEKLIHCEKKLKETTNQVKTMEQSFVRLSNKLRSDTPNWRPKCKAWADCTSQYKNQQRKKIKLDVKNSLSFTETENFLPV